MAIQHLSFEQLYQVAKLEKLECKSTKELAPIDEIVGQERAQKAVEFCDVNQREGIQHLRDWPQWARQAYYDFALSQPPSTRCQ